MLKSFSQSNPANNNLQFVSITNKASGGSIGAAVDTVDSYMGASVVQTTASQTLTLPSPTGNAPKIFIVCNDGSTSFTMNQKVVYPGTSLICVFSGVLVPNQGRVWSTMGASATLTTVTTTTV